MSYSKHSLHLNIRHFYFANAIKRKEVEIGYCPTKVMLEDFFTKPLQENVFRKFRAVILGHVSVSALFQINEKSSKERVEAHMENHP